MRRKKEKQPTRMELENGMVYNQMIDATTSDASARALGLVLCAIHERQGQMLEELKQMAGNTYRFR